MANLLSSFLNGSSTFTYNNGTNVIPSYTLVQPTFSNTSTGASIFNQTFGSSSSFGNSLLFGSSLGGSTLTGSFGNSFNVGGFNTSFNYGSLGNGFGFGSGIVVGSNPVITTTPTTTTTLSGTTIATVQTDEGDNYTFIGSNFTDADGNAAASMQVVDLPDNGILEIDGDEVALNQIITVDDFDNLDYVPDTDFDSTDGFSVRLSNDGVTYETVNSNVVINVLGESDKPELGFVSDFSVVEGATVSGIGNAIISAFSDVDTGDYLSEAQIEFEDGDELGQLEYTSDNGGTISLTEDDETKTLSANELTTLQFVANTGAIGEGNDPEDVTVRVLLTDSDGLQSASTYDITIEVSDGNDAPDFKESYASTAAVTENLRYFGNGLNPAEDLETPSELSYSITGTDSDLFNVDSTNGDLSFIEAPDFEDPLDSNGDNFYSFTLNVSDPSGATASTDVVVKVTNETANLALTDASLNIDEGETFAITASAVMEDSSNVVTYSIDENSADAEFFEIDPDSGVLSFIYAPDAENPTDNKVGASTGTYVVAVIATDESGEAEAANGAYSFSTDTYATATGTFTVTVDNIDDEAPEFVSASASSVPVTFTIGADIDDLSVKFPETETAATDLMTLVVSNGETGATSVDLSYELVSDAGTSNFAFDSSTKVLSIVSGAEFDYEGDHGATIELTLEISDDADGYTAETVISVELVDVNEVPTIGSVQPVIVPEIGTVEFGENILDVSADVDSDELFFEFDTTNSSSKVDLLYRVGGGNNSPLIAYDVMFDKYLNEDELETLTFEADASRANNSGSLTFTVYDHDPDDTSTTGLSDTGSISFLVADL